MILFTLCLLADLYFVGRLGPDAVAAIGIGWRILNAIYLPVIALSSATAAMIGQNYGAAKPLRVQQTFRLSASTAVLYMIGCTALCWLVPAELVGVFTRDSEVLAYGREYLTIFMLSNAFVGMIMVMGAAFQGLGKTYPSLVGAIIDNTI